MRPLLRHRLRQGVERNIIRAIKRVDPIYDHFLRELRYPLLPKIVVYTIIPKEDYTSFFDK